MTYMNIPSFDTDGAHINSGHVVSVVVFQCATLKRLEGPWGYGLFVAVI